AGLAVRRAGPSGRRCRGPRDLLCRLRGGERSPGRPGAGPLVGGLRQRLLGGGRALADPAVPVGGAGHRAARHRASGERDGLGGPATPADRTGGLMFDRPDAATVLFGLAAFLEQDVRPALQDKALAFRVRIAAHLAQTLALQAGLEDDATIAAV